MPPEESTGSGCDVPLAMRDPRRLRSARTRGSYAGHGPAGPKERARETVGVDRRRRFSAGDQAPTSFDSCDSHP